MHFSATLFKNTEVFVIPQHLHLQDSCHTAHYFCGQSLFRHSTQWIPTSATSSNNIRKKTRTMEHVSVLREWRYLVPPGSPVLFLLYCTSSLTVLHTSSSQSVTPAHCNVQEHAKRYAAPTRSSAPRVMKQASYFFSFHWLFTI